MTTPDIPAMRQTIARYEGTLSRLCDVLGVTPDTSKGQPGPLFCEALEKWLFERKGKAKLEWHGEMFG